MYAQKIDKIETTIIDLKNTIESLKMERETQIDNVQKVCKEIIDKLDEKHQLIK